MAWKYPTGAYKAYVPKGRGMRAAMGGLRGGVEAFTSQMLAIRQYEAEKEEKRQQRMREQAQAQVEQLATEQKEERMFKQQEAMQHGGYLNTLQIEKMRQTGRLELEAAKKKEEEGDKWQTELDKHLSKLDKLETDFAQRRADEIRQAIEVGDVGKLTEIHRQVLQNADLMREYKRKTTTKDGKPTEVIETSNDINDLQGALYYITRLMKQKYGEPAPQAEPTATRNSIEFRADRARIITLLKAGRENDALQMMRKYDLTQEEVEAIEREAGIR